MIPAIDTLKTMSGAAVLLALRDALLDEADRIRSLEEQLVAIGHKPQWSACRASAHHSIVAAAEVIERLRQAGETARAAKQKPAALVLLAADVARSMLIVEAQRLEKGQSDAPAAILGHEEASDAIAAS